MSCARSFNEIISDSDERHSPQSSPGRKPGHEYAASVSWAEILQPHGFKSAGRRGDVTLWTRPGKDHGVSASTNHAGSDLFYPFSTNCYPFDSERGYGKFSVYTLLNHDGDFRAAAKALASDGYGDAPANKHSQPAVPTQPIVESENQIITVRDMMPSIEALHVTGLERGKSTGWSSLDEWYTVRKREWTLITGHPNHGKSCWLDNLMVNLARRHGWRFGIFSAENLPLERYMASFLEISTGKPFSKGITERLTIEEIRASAEWLHKHFKFINPSMELRRIDHLLAVADVLVSQHRVDALVIDPWNELDHARPPNIREDEYISVSLSKVRYFTRSKNVHFFIVAHPAKSYRDASGKHPVPTLFDVKGASEWNAKADNGICVWRDMVNHDNGTDIHVQKVRFREVGKAGGGCNLRYDVVTGRFTDPNHRPTIDELMAEPYTGQF